MARGAELPLALTMGDPAGIGGDIALKAWLRRDEKIPPFFMLDDPGRLEALARRIGLHVPVEVIEASEQVADTFQRTLPVLPVVLPVPAVPGIAEPANGPAVIEAIERAVTLVQTGKAAAVVTNPINKKVLHQAGFAHPGHTEFLAHLAGGNLRPIMMLACPGLRVIPVTVHLSVRDAVAALNTDAIVAAGEIVAKALRRYFALPNPRLAVAALNPHAGESGEMGREEIDVIGPAIDALRSQGISVSGPAPADTLFHAEARQTYDACLCMYHDQALIPIKTIDFHGGVNVTLGLPFVRTSPDHGTAYGIAGTGTANEASLVAALRLAAEMASRPTVSA